MKKPKAPAKLDTAAIRSRLEAPIYATATKGRLYLALRDARSDCADLLQEVERQNDCLVQTVTAFIERIEQLERQVTKQMIHIAMQPSNAGDLAK